MAIHDRSAKDVGSWFHGIFRFFGFLLAVGLLAFVLFIGGLFTYNAFSGGAAGAYWQDGVIRLEEDGSRAAARTGLDGAWQVITDPFSLRDPVVWSDELPVSEFESEPGVEIKSIEPLANYYLSGEPITVLVQVEGDSLKEKPSSMEFSCELKDYEDAPRVEPESFELDARPGLQRTSFFCDFLSGVKVDAKEEGVAKKFTAKVNYEYEQIGALRVYFMQDKKLRDYVAKKGNPLEQWDDKRLYSLDDGTIRSQADPGPMRMAIEVPQSQPLTDGEPYQRVPLRITFARNLEYLGTFAGFNHFELRLPPTVSTHEGASCDFQDTGKIDERGLRIYELTDRAKERKVDIDCSVQEFLTESECVDQYFNRFTFTCSFGVDYLVNEQDFSNFYVNVKYDFEIKKSRTVDVKPFKVATVCNAVEDEFSCLDERGCVPLYGVDESDYLRCDTCPSDWLYCTDYGTSEALCNSDPCAPTDDLRCEFVEGNCKAMGV